MKNLLKYIKQYRVEAILGPLFKLTEALFELFVPLVVAEIIDKGIIGECNKGLVISHSIVMIALGLIGFVCAVIAQYFAAKASVGFASNLRAALYDKVTASSYTDLDNIGTSTLITRMTGDVNQVQTGVNLALRLLLRSPFIVFGAMIMAFTVDTKSALIFVASIPLLAVIIAVIMRVTVPLYKNAQKKLDGISLTTRESLKGVRVIRAFRKEDAETKQFSESNDGLTALQLFAGKISALMNPLTYIVVNTAVIAIIWVGGKRVYSGNLTPGAIIALYNYMSQILVELIKLANMVMTINKSLASASRIDAVLSDKGHTEKSPEENVTLDPDAAVEFKNVHFKYLSAGEESLTDISIAVKRGEKIGIIGATGSGKSTFVNLIPHFYGATEGTVAVNGRDVKTYSDKELRGLIGIVPQKSVLFKGSIRENLLLGGKTADDASLMRAAEAAEAADTIKSKGGLDALIEQNGRNLSGGQRQRLCIARALVGEPEILILDDSSSALDFATEARLRKAIASLPFNPTVFTVSQRVSSVMNADRIIVLDDGKIAGLGTHGELLKSCEIYADICATQLGEEETAK